jgi:two-component system, OmpR family, sensor histidine kinase VicK
VVTRLELYNRIRLQEQAQRQRQRTERALAIERCFVAATLDSIPALVTVLDTAGRVVRMNDPCSQLTGLSLAHAIGRPFVEEFLEEDDRAWAAGKLREAVAGQVSGPHETAWRAAGGRRRRVSWTLRPLQGPNGEIQYLIVSGQDVTDQREMEKALLSSEARYREMVENSLGVCLHLLDGGPADFAECVYGGDPGISARRLLGRMVTELMDATEWRRSRIA